VSRVTDPEEALAQAPLLRRVHERHPDVDLVVLPPEGPAPDPTLAPVPVTDAALAAERDAVTAVLAALVAAAGRAEEPVTTWRTAGSSTRVVPVAEARLPFDGAQDGIELGRALSARLRADGWAGSVDRTGVTVLLHATREDRSARVAWLDDAVLVAVTGRVLPVATATARDLISGEDAR
jgi:hypothetical protein